MVKENKMNYKHQQEAIDQALELLRAVENSVSGPPRDDMAKIVDNLRAFSDAEIDIRLSDIRAQATR